MIISAMNVVKKVNVILLFQLEYDSGRNDVPNTPMAPINPVFDATVMW
jgi:hypothetical protein